MVEEYPSPASPPRLAACEMRAAIDWHELRALADNLADVPAPLRIVGPRELDACSVCPDSDAWDPAPAVADIVYTVGVWTYREPSCELHVRPAVRWHRSYGKTDIAVEIPAPVLHLLDAVVGVMGAVIGPVILQRVAPGQYRSADARWTVTRHGSGQLLRWVIGDACGRLTTIADTIAPTLDYARHLIDTQQEAEVAAVAVPDPFARIPVAPSDEPW